MHLARVQDLRPVSIRPAETVNRRWPAAVFGAKSVCQGGLVRRAVRDVEREVGRDLFEAEVARRGFHLVQSGDQFPIICNSAPLRIIC